MGKIWELTKNDFIKGLIVVVISAVLTVIVEALKNGGAIGWDNVLNVALIAGLSYILKNLGTDDKGKFGGVI